MPLERREVEAALDRKGFELSDGGDHRFYTYHSRNGEKTSVWTKISHGTKYKTLGDNLVSAMASQCGLTSPQFKRLIDCPLSRDDYENILLVSKRIALKSSEKSS